MPRNIPGEVFGPYLVYERLGVGGMATVHRATQRGIAGFERVVALKRLLPHLADDEAFVRSFVREAKLASLLQHANIAHIYELGRVGATYFMAMEHVEGHDVRRILRRTFRDRARIPIPVVLAILGELCDALDYAHARTDDATGEPLGIVHCDVSPSNLIVTPEGHLKVIDFGIAKATSQKLSTASGRVKGKLGYMSPEAARGDRLDARSDVFSAGVVAHELIAVRPLFSARSEYETLRRIQQGEVVPPSVYTPACPPELDDLVMRALARNPAARFATAAHMRRAIDAVAGALATPVTSARVAEWMIGAIGPRRAPTTPPETLPVGPLDGPLDGIDDEATQIAWGARTGDGRVVVVPDVPDVSDRIPILLDGARIEPVRTPRLRQGSTRSGMVEAAAPIAAVRQEPPPPVVTFRATPPTTPRAFPAGTTPPPPSLDPSSLRGEGRVWAARRRIVAAIAVSALTVAALAIGLWPDAAPERVRIVFDVEPADAAIAIDGEPVDARTTASAGAHDIAITRPGYEPWRTRVELAPGEAHTFRVVLEPTRPASR